MNGKRNNLNQKINRIEDGNYIINICINKSKRADKSFFFFFSLMMIKGRTTAAHIHIMLALRSLTYLKSISNYQCSVYIRIYIESASKKTFNIMLVELEYFFQYFQSFLLIFFETPLYIINYTGWYQVYRSNFNSY